MNRARLLVRLVVVCALTLSVFVPAAPAVAEPAQSGIQVGPVFVRHEGRRYRVMLDAYEWYGDGYVEMSLRRRKDPDGDGVISSIQGHDWGISDLGDIFTASPRLESATLSTASRMDPYGMAEYKFSATGALRDSCDGGRRQRRGVVTGRLVIRTHSPLGSIEITDAPALAWTAGRRCGPPPHGKPYPDRCHAEEQIFGLRQRDMMVASAWWRPRGQRVRIEVDHNRELNLDRPRTYGDVSHWIVTHVPRDHARLSADVTRGHFRGAAGTFTTGRATFGATNGDASGGGICTRSDGGDYEHNSDALHGRLTGNFKANFYIGKDFSLSDGPVGAIGGRYTVKPYTWQ